MVRQATVVALKGEARPRFKWPAGWVWLKSLFLRGRCRATYFNYAKKFHPAAR
jgi:hypothetical protein